MGFELNISALLSTLRSYTYDGTLEVSVSHVAMLVVQPNALVDYFVLPQDQCFPQRGVPGCSPPLVSFDVVIGMFNLL